MGIRVGDKIKWKDYPEVYTVTHIDLNNPHYQISWSWFDPFDNILRTTSCNSVHQMERLMEERITIFVYKVGTLEPRKNLKQLNFI